MNQGAGKRLIMAVAFAGACALLLAHGGALAEDKPSEDTTKAVDAFLEKMTPTYREQLEGMIAARSGEIITGLSLPPDRADQVKALAKQAVDASLAAWLKTARTSLLHFPEETRNRLLKSQTYYASRNEKDAPENQAIWKDGLARLLTDEDRARLLTAQDDKKKRRVRAVARLMVAVLDEKLALTTEQRPKMEPVVEEAVQGEKQFFPEPEKNAGRSQYYTLSDDLFYKAATRVNPEDVRPILDGPQQKRWANLGKSSSPNDNDEPPAPTPTLTAESEPEDAEGAVSDFLRLKTAAGYRQLEATMLLQTEDVARITGLTGPHAAHLRTAALGATEAAMNDWEQSIEQTVRSLVQDATRDTVQARLADANRYYFNAPDAGSQRLWTTAVKTELTPAQQATWQAERDARARYSDDAIAGFLLAEFDRKFSPPPDVRDRLGPVLAKAIHDYQPDINQMFTYNRGSAWYLTYYSMFLPMQALSEAEGKSLLGPECYGRWTHSTEYTYSTNYWNNVRQYHENRLRENKQ